MIGWKFRPYQEGEIKVDPIENQFFTTNEVGNISNAIVREGIQNALDETIGDLTIIRIFLSGEKYKLQKQQAIPYINELLEHLKAKGSGILSLPDFGLGMKYLVFEDFNTNGLLGDPNESKDSDTQRTDVKHNYFWFWRNVGRSGKSDEKLGRWGLGKTVFPASSRINTFWGLTVKKDAPGKQFLMGQSILRSHNILNSFQDYGFTPYGFYGDFKTENFASPVIENGVIAQFKNTFNLERANETGLSIVIPYINEEITFERLIYSTIEQYFFPIITGKLNVQIQFEDEKINLTKHTIRQTVNNFDFSLFDNDENLRVKTKDAFIKLFQFADYIESLKEDDYTHLKQPSKNGTPLWMESLFDAGTFSQLQDKFENGERVAFKVPLKYQPHGNEPEIRWYKAFLEKDSTLEKAENHFIRKGITITGVNSLKSPGVRGVVLIDDEKLVTLIGDAENPAHTEIQKDSRNFKDKYVDGDKCLSFLDKTLQKLYLKLQKPAKGLEKDLLNDFFFIPEDNEKNEDILPDDDSGKDITAKEKQDVFGKKSLVKIFKLENGFKIVNNPNVEVTKDIVFEIKLGYRTSRGDPISRYEKLDFDINNFPIKVKFSGVEILNRFDNIIGFKSLNDNFMIEVTGFDSKRDLVIKLMS